MHYVPPDSLMQHFHVFNQSKFTSRQLLTSYLSLFHWLALVGVDLCTRREVPITLPVSKIAKESKIYQHEWVTQVLQTVAQNHKFFQPNVFFGIQLRVPCLQCNFAKIFGIRKLPWSLQAIIQHWLLEDGFSHFHTIPVV